MFVGTDPPAVADEMLQVIARAALDGSEVLFTRGGGLFLPLPLRLSHPVPLGPLDLPLFDAKREFLAQAPYQFNMIVCELALLGGIPAEPVSALYVQPASVVDDHALVNSGGGSGPMNRDRALAGALFDLLRDDWRAWSRDAEVLAENSCRLNLSTKLREVSSALPTLVAGAYFHHVNGATVEAHADSSTVTEAIVGAFWARLVAGNNGAAQLALRKTISTPRRLDLLVAEDKAFERLHADFQLANPGRVKLVHSAVADDESAHLSINAMRTAVELLCGEPVAQPVPSTPNYW